MNARSITIGNVLGEGASAVTYEGTDERGRTVCVKQYKTGLDSKSLEKIDREIEVLKRLTHSQIPAVFGAYEQEVGGRSLLHVVQEMVDGQNLKEWSEENLLTVPMVQQIIGEVLGILKYLHSYVPPIIHRDIKPSNVMRRLDGGIVLIDFGQAIQDIHRTFGQTLVTGTLGYQPPEQIMGKASPQSDVYSLGVVAVEFLSGRSAHTMLEGQVLRWEKHCRRLPLPIQEWLDGMLHPEDAKRYSAKEALDHLEQISEVFVDPQTSPNTVELQASAKFLEMLDDAIIEEAEHKRRTREDQHRRMVEQERESDSRQDQEDRWVQSETQLLTEMLSSWEQLLNAVQSEKVSWERGLSTFVGAFIDRVISCEDQRAWGSIDHRITILVAVARNNDLFNSDYQQWVLETFLQPQIDHLELIKLQHSALARDLAMAEQELRLQPWWALLKKNTLTQKVLTLQSELSNCEKGISNTEDVIKILKVRYAAI